MKSNGTLSRTSQFLAELAALTDQGRVVWAFDTVYPEINTCKLKSAGAPFSITFDFGEITLTVNAAWVPIEAREKADMFELAQSIYKYYGRRHKNRPSKKKNKEYRRILGEALALIEEIEKTPVS